MSIPMLPEGLPGLPAPAGLPQGAAPAGLPPMPAPAMPPMPPPPMPPTGLPGAGGGMPPPEPQKRPIDLPADPVSQPKKRKKPPKPPKPTLGDILRWADEDRDYWLPRNERMLEDQKLIEMSNPVILSSKKDKAAQIHRIIRNTPWRIVEKISAVAGKDPPKIKVPPRRLDTTDAAQRIEDFCYYWRAEVDEQWQQGIHSSRNREKAWMLAGRGWVTGLIAYNPDDEDFPWQVRLHDPINVYPRPGAGPGGLRHVIHRYSASSGQIAADYPVFKEKLEAHFEDKRTKAGITAGDRGGPQDIHEVIAYFDTHYWALVIDGKLIAMPEHGYGFNPWTIRIRGGSPLRTSATDGSFDHLSTRFVGTSAIEGIKGPYRDMNRIMTQIAAQVQKAADPPTVQKYNEDNGEPEEISTAPGARNKIPVDEDIKGLTELTQTPNEVQHVLAGLTEDINLAGLPPVLYGEGAPNLAGYAITLLNATARDVFFPITSAIESYDREELRKVLLLYEEFGDGSVFFVGRSAGSQAAYGNELTPDDITQNGTFMLVEFGSVMPQDIIAMGNLGGMLIERNVIDRAQVHDWIGIDDSPRMMTRVMAERITQSEDLMKLVMIPDALRKIDPALADAYMELVIGPMLSGGEMGGGGPTGPAPGGAPGIPAGLGGMGAMGAEQAGVPPPTMPGMPPGVLPPQLQSPGQPTNPQGGPDPGMAPGMGAMMRRLLAQQ